MLRSVPVSAAQGGPPAAATATVPAAAPTTAVPPSTMPPLLLLLLEVGGAALAVAAQLGHHALPLLAAPGGVKVGGGVLALLPCRLLGPHLLDLAPVVVEVVVVLPPPLGQLLQARGCGPPGSSTRGSLLTRAAGRPPLQGVPAGCEWGA